jgi:hypothetical protein
VLIAENQNSKQVSSPKKQQIVEKLTKELFFKWKGGKFGKASGKKTISVNGTEYWCSPEQVEFIKAHKLYKEL